MGGDVRETRQLLNRGQRPDPLLMSHSLRSDDDEEEDVEGSSSDSKTLGVKI